MSEPGDECFEWHPEFRGRSLREVETELEQALRADQRSYALLMEGAEGNENDALAAVLPMERRWGAFDLDWAEADPASLAVRVVAFERERDRRQELFPYNDLRATAEPAPTATGADEPPWWAFWRR